MSKNVIATVLQLLDKKEDDIIRLKIEAILSEILSYLNRDEVDEQIFSVVCSTISDCIKSDDLGGKIQTLKEGDMQVTYKTDSPFFGKLDSFKKIRGIN